MGGPAYRGGMTASRIALVTGATMDWAAPSSRDWPPAWPGGPGPADRPRPGARAGAAPTWPPAPRPPCRGPGAGRDRRRGLASLAAGLGEVDVVFSNAAARVSPTRSRRRVHRRRRDQPPPRAILRAFAPRLRPGGLLIVVASALGTLDKLDDRVAGRFAAVTHTDLDAVDTLVSEWRQAVHDGRAEQEGFGTWLNIPSPRSLRSPPSAPLAARTPHGRSGRGQARSWRSARALSTRTHRAPGSRT